MAYTQESMFKEIMKRSGQIRYRAERKKAYGLAAASLFAVLCLCCAYSAFSGTVIADGSRQVYGAFLLPGAAGGFVLAAVIAFAAGVAVTLLCINKRKRDPGIDVKTASGEESGHEETA